MIQISVGLGWVVGRDKGGEGECVTVDVPQMDTDEQHFVMVLSKTWGDVLRGWDGCWEGIKVERGTV